MAESRIAILPDDLSNQIAAGEVVERPASAVKELVENALDAGAKRVFIEVEDGGRRRIRVIDDGMGMTRSDAQLAVVRHATSKVRTTDDLRAIRSLGFRGEALPSMASVSNFTLTTRPADETVGTRVHLGGGGTAEVTDAGCAPGTTVEVADLFFNVPARRKFLRTVATEFGHISHLASTFALGYPEVHFRLTHNGKVTVDYPAESDLRGRVYAVLGRQVARRLYEVALDADVEVRGFVSEPTLNRPGTSHLTTFINGRYVRDKLVYRAIANAYGNLIDRGRYPYALLWVRLPEDEVDVNVHPTKSEVRFVHSGAVFSALGRAIKLTLSQAPWTSQQRVDIAARPSTAPSPPRPDFGAEPSTLEDGQRPSQTYRPLWPKPKRRWEPTEPVARPEPSPRFTLAFDAKPSEPSEAATGLPSSDGQPSGQGHLFSEEKRLATNPGDEGYFSQLLYLGQMKKTYLVCQTDREMVLIDQHAADERYHYERLRRLFAAKKLAAQPLLFAESLELEPALAAVATDQRDRLFAMGIELEPFGGATYALKAVPDLLLGHDYVAVVRDVLSELADAGHSRSLDDRADLVFATMACHTAMRAGDEVSPAEARALLERMDATPYRANCPHGRPVLAITPFSEIEGWFHRR